MKVVTVYPNNLTVIDSYQLAEDSAGRITVGLFQGDDYVYVPGGSEHLSFCNERR